MGGCRTLIRGPSRRIVDMGLATIHPSFLIDGEA
jgi:hypothetical protein